MDCRQHHDPDRQVRLLDVRFNINATGPVTNKEHVQRHVKNLSRNQDRQSRTDADESVEGDAVGLALS